MDSDEWGICIRIHICCRIGRTAIVDTLFLRTDSIAYAKIGFLISVGSSSSLTLIGYLYDFTGTYLYMLVIAMAFHIIDLCLLVIIMKKVKSEYNRSLK